MIRWYFIGALIFCLMDAADQHTATLIAAGKCLQEKADALYTNHEQKKKKISKAPPALKLHLHPSLKQTRVPQSNAGASNEVLYTLYFNALAHFRSAYQEEEKTPLQALQARLQAEQTMQRLSDLSVHPDNKQMLIIGPWRQLLTFWQGQSTLPEIPTIVREAYDSHTICKDALEASLTEHGHATYLAECIDNMRALHYAYNHTTEPLSKQRIQLYTHIFFKLLKDHSSSLSNAPLTISNHLERKPIDPELFFTQAQKLLDTGQKEFTTATVQQSAALKTEYMQLFCDMLCDFEHLYTYAYKDVITRFHTEYYAQQLIACIEKHHLRDEQCDEWHTLIHEWQERSQDPIAWLNALQKIITPFFSQPQPTKKKGKKQEKKKDKKEAEEQKAEIGAQYLLPLWRIFEQADEPTPQTQAASSSDRTPINLKDPKKRYIQLKAALCAEQIKAAIWPHREDENLHNLSPHLHEAFRPWVRHRHEAFVGSTIDYMHKCLDQDDTNKKHTLFWIGKLFFLLDGPSREQNKSLLDSCTEQLFQLYTQAPEFNDEELALLFYCVQETKQDVMEKAIIRIKSHRELQKDLAQKRETLASHIKEIKQYKKKKREAPIDLLKETAHLLMHLDKYKAYNKKDQQQKQMKKDLQQFTLHLLTCYKEHPLAHQETRPILLALAEPSGMHHIPEEIEQIDNGPLGPTSIKRLFARLKETEERLTKELAQKKAR